MKLGNLKKPYENLMDGTHLWYEPPITQKEAEKLNQQGAVNAKTTLGQPWTHAKAIVTVLCAQDVAEDGIEATEAGLLAQKVWAAAKEDNEVDLVAADVVLIRKMAIQMEKFPTMCRGPLENELKIAETMATDQPASDTSE